MATSLEVSKNMRCASVHPEPINAYVKSERSVGRMIQVAVDTSGLCIREVETEMWGVNDWVDLVLCSVWYI